MTLFFLGAVSAPLAALLFLVVRALTCPCETDMARFGDVPLRRGEAANSYFGPCPRCGKRYVRAVEWARAVIEWEKETGEKWNG